MGPKVTLLLAKTRGGFLNCHLFKNGGWGTKPTYIFLVIIPLLVIELKATHNGNPSDDFLLEAEICGQKFVTIGSSLELDHQ